MAVNSISSSPAADSEMIFQYFLLFIPFFVLAQEWNYDNQNKWPKQCLNGVEQSPININLDDVQYKKTKKQIKFTGYCSEIDWKFAFEHDTVKASFLDPDEEVEMTMSGGDLNNNVYKLEQFHLHWRSEHLFNNYRFDYEVHLVHYNKKYRSFNEALGKEDGVAVVARFFNIVRENNFETRKFLSILNPITKVLNDEAKESREFTLSIGDVLVDGFREYYTYMGSLTTPPCTEKVKWIVEVEPKVVGPKYQIITKQKFVNGYDETLWPKNFRQVQKIGNRCVNQVCLYNCK